jgi:putative DNA primase/helicase
MRLQRSSRRGLGAEVHAMSRHDNDRQGAGCGPQSSRELALRYTELGWAVLPCSPASKAPLTARGFKDATADTDRVNELFGAKPKAMIGIATGRDTGIFVLDVDVDEAEGKNGLADLADLENYFQELPSGYRVWTPRGGLHLYFRYPAHLKVGSKVALAGPDGRPLSIDVRGDGGYVIAAGSIRADGAAYEPADATWPPHVPEAPQWLLDLVVGRKSDWAAQPLGNHLSRSGIGHARYALAALADECLQVRTATEGTRNQRLYMASRKLAQFFEAKLLDEDDVRTALIAAAVEAGLDRDPNCGLRGIRKTIESGFKMGKGQPRRVPGLRQGKPAKKKGVQREPEEDGPGEDEDLLITEEAIATEVAARYGGSLLYCVDDGKWYRWAGTHWQRDDTRETFDISRRVAAEMAASADAKDRKAAGRATFVSGVEKFCQCDPVFSTKAEAFDVDPFLLGTPTGVVDLRTGICRPAVPDDRITKLTGCGVAKTADCPQFLNFLWEITGGDPDLIRFFQQWFGYCLTGATTEHALLFIHGPGGNGKSVLLNVIAGILGEYAANAPMETLTASAGDKHPTDLAGLRGARLVTASETEGGRAWGEQRVKQMTGGDPITARFMRRDFFTYTPTFKIVVAGNHKPDLKNVDDAMRRRLNVVHFGYKPTNPDRELEAKLKAEGPGILRWAIDGCLDWQRNGLIRPASMLEETRRYFVEQDVVGQWLECCCEVTRDGSAKETFANLFSSWTGFCAQTGGDVGSKKDFSSKLRKLGFESKRGTGGTVTYIGIRLSRDFAMAAE